MLESIFNSEFHDKLIEKRKIFGLVDLNFIIFPYNFWTIHFFLAIFREITIFDAWE